jgi:uracil-DNA glycosylase family protein
VTESASAYLPERPTLPRLREAAARCRACPLSQTGTQTVFGEGPAGAEVMLVGEQPGDQEDKQGRPFVEPAGRVLDEALELAGIDCGRAYLTNAVKHFKWEARGKRRIHAKPTWSEQTACKPWLELAEYVTATIHPSAVLRQRDTESRHRELASFVADLKLVASVL